MIGDVHVDFSTTLFSKTVSNDGLLVAMQNFDDIASVTGHYGNFSRRTLSISSSTRERTRGRGKEFSAKEEGKVEIPRGDGGT